MLRCWYVQAALEGEAKAEVRVEVRVGHYAQMDLLRGKLIWELLSFLGFSKLLVRVEESSNWK